MPSARAIRPDSYWNPASLLLAHFKLFASLSAEAPAQAGFHAHAYTPPRIWLRPAHKVT